MEKTCDECKNRALSFADCDGRTLCTHCLASALRYARSGMKTYEETLSRLRAQLGVPESETSDARIAELVDAEKVLKAKGLAREEFEAKQRRISDLERELSAAQVENTRLKRELDAAADYHDACGKAVEDALAGDIIDGHLGARYDKISASVLRIRRERDAAKAATTSVRGELVRARGEAREAKDSVDTWRRYWEEQHQNRIAERDAAIAETSALRRELIESRQLLLAGGTRFDLRTLQVRLPWTIKYSGDFRTNPQSHKDFAHALLHVAKASGMLAMFVDKMDHDRDAALDPDKRTSFAPYVADLVVCALRMANTFPGGPIDIERAVVERIETKNGVKL